MKNILVVSPRIPKFDTNAGDWRIYTLCKALAENFKVFLLPVKLYGDEEEYIKKLELFNVEIFFQDKEKNYNFYEILEKLKIDTIIFEYYYYFTNFIRFIPKNVKKVIDLHEIQYLKYYRKLKLKNKKLSIKEYNIVKKYEISIYNKADVLIAISDIEKKELKKELPNKLIIVQPTEIEIDTNIKRLKFEERKDLVFLGSFNNFLENPNTDAVFYFLNNIFFKVKKSIPHIKFHIIGTNSKMFESFISRDILKDVNIIGWVNNIYEYMVNYKVFVCPLRYGAGVKKKVLDALFSGTPVVSTSIGIQGLNLKNGVHFLLSDSISSFVKNIVSIYNNEHLWNKIAVSGLDSLCVEIHKNNCYESLFKFL